MLDRLDKEIIIALQHNGRESYMDLARLLHVSEATVRNRIKKLLDTGIIKVAAIPDLDILGYKFMGIVGVQIQLEHRHEVEAQLIGNPNVCYLAVVAGRYDFIAIVVTKTSGEFAEFVQNVISRIPGIMRTETCVGLDICKGMRAGMDTASLVANYNVSNDSE